MTKIVNIYIAYDLDAWPKNPTSNLKIKNCLFGATSIVKNSDKKRKECDKEKYLYSGYRTTFDSGGEWSFDNDTSRNFIIFSVDNISSSQSDNRKNNFLILGESSTFG